MNEDERNKAAYQRKLAELLRSLSNLEAELRAVSDALREPEAQGQGETARPVLRDFDQEMEARRESAEYQEVRQRYEPLAAKLEQAADEKERRVLLETPAPTDRVQ